MQKVRVHKGYLYYETTDGLRRCPVSVPAMDALEKKGYALKPLLTLNGKLSKPLYKYQFECVNAAWQRGWSLLIADAMGVGKSAEAIAIHAASKSKKTLVVVPANITYQWCRAFNEWLKRPTHIKLCTGKSYELPDVIEVQKSRIVIINYCVINDWLEVLNSFDWDLMILDESHRVKNPHASCTHAVFTLRDRVRACVCLSGTPLTDRTADIYSSIKLVNPSLFPSRFAFEQRYCGGVLDSYGRHNTSINTIELHHKLVESGTMIRRTKKDVYDEIPRIRIEMIPMKVDTRTLDHIEQTAYREKQSYQNAYGRGRGIAAMQLQNTLESYLQEATRLKLPLSIKWIEDFLDNSNEKLVVACVHREKCSELLHNYFGDKSLLINGGLTAKQKDAVLNEFITGDCRLLIGNINSISAGIDGLQKVCSNLAVLELCWSPADLQQLFARLDRNGQENPVTVYIHAVMGSLDEMLARMLDKKGNIVSEVLDGVSMSKKESLLKMMEDMK